MKKKSVKAVKTAKRASSKPVQPDWSEYFTRLEDRLRRLEEKIDRVLTPQPAQPVFIQEMPRESRDLNGSQAASQPKQEHQNGRILYQAVCSDCGDGCEVPFKPSGERPVYCKKCFSARKKSRSLPGHSQKPQNHGEAVEVPVFPSGVGRVKISGHVVPLSGPRDRRHDHGKPKRHRRFH